MSITESRQEAWVTQACNITETRYWPQSTRHVHSLIHTANVHWASAKIQALCWGQGVKHHQYWVLRPSLPGEKLFSSVALSCPTLCDPMDCSTPGLLSITISWSWPKLMFTKVVMPFSHLILCHPLLLLPSIFPSIRVFSNESALCIRRPQYWSFSFSVSPSNEYSGLISFRMDWLDLLAVQGTLRSLLQHHSSEASILWRSAFFIVQLSHPYMTIGKTIALTRRTCVHTVTEGNLGVSRVHGSPGVEEIGCSGRFRGLSCSPQSTAPCPHRASHTFTSDPLPTSPPSLLTLKDSTALSKEGQSDWQLTLEDLGAPVVEMGWQLRVSWKEHRWGGSRGKGVGRSGHGRESVKLATHLGAP